MSDFFFSFIVMRVFDVKRFISDLSVAATPLTFEGLAVLILPFDILSNEIPKQKRCLKCNMLSMLILFYFFLGMVWVFPIASVVLLSVFGKSKLYIRLILI